MSLKTAIAAFAAFLLLAAGAVNAPEARAEGAPARHSYEEVKSFVDRAVAHLKKAGPEKALADFNDPKAGWIDGDLYIFVFDTKGVYRASGYKPERTGTTAWTMKDASGQTYVVQEIVRQAQKKGEALVDYLWMNPGTGKLENKTSYVVMVGDLVVGAGFYHQ